MIHNQSRAIEWLERWFFVCDDTVLQTLTKLLAECRSGLDNSGEVKICIYLGPIISSIPLLTPHVVNSPSGRGVVSAMSCFQGCGPGGWSGGVGEWMAQTQSPATPILKRLKRLRPSDAFGLLCISSATGRRSGQLYVC